MNTGEVLLKITQLTPGFEEQRLSLDGTQESPEGVEYTVFTVSVQKPGSQACLTIRPALPTTLIEDEATWNTLIEAMVVEFNKYLV